MVTTHPRLKYIAGDLVKLEIKEKDEYKLHACNAQGVWGSGIAAQFKKKYPKSFEDYKHFCVDQGADSGECIITDDKIINLITSSHFSPCDGVYTVLYNTWLSFGALASQLPREPVTIYSNRFNSGLFNVPWEMTERLVLNFLDLNPNISWVVVDLPEKVSK